MWILPKNYNCSHSAQDMVESSEDLSLLESHLEQSLMWRSKPSQLRTWLQRWKKGGWFRHLSGRMLKPCHWKSFETELTSSLEVIHASPSRQQGKGKGQKIQDTCGRTSSEQLMLFDLDEYSLKMSKDTSVSVYKKSSRVWKSEVTKQRGEYSLRRKLVQAIKEKEYSYWLTPTVTQMNRTEDRMEKRIKYRESIGRKYVPGCLEEQVKNWATPTARDWKGCGNAKPRKDGKSRMDTIEAQVKYSHHHKEQKPEIGKNQDLNPDWVEQMMGLSVGWTDLGSWGMESCHKQQL